MRAHQSCKAVGFLINKDNNNSCGSHPSSAVRGQIPAPPRPPLGGALCTTCLSALTLLMLRLLSSKAQRRIFFSETSKTCHVGIHWIPLDEYSRMSTHTTGFQSFFSFFASFCIGHTGTYVFSTLLTVLSISPSDKSGTGKETYSKCTTSRRWRLAWLHLSYLIAHVCVAAVLLSGWWGSNWDKLEFKRKALHHTVISSSSTFSEQSFRD